MLRTKHRKHQKRKLNYTVSEVSVENGVAIVAFESREDGSVYQTVLKVGMKVHVDFHFDADRADTAGTTITPLL